MKKFSIKLFEQWSDQDPLFYKIEEEEFNNNEYSVEISGADLARIGLIFTDFSFNKDVFPDLHICNVDSSMFVYIMSQNDQPSSNIRIMKLIFWRDIDNWYYVCVYHKSARGFSLMTSRPQLYNILTYFKCDWIDGLQALKDKFYS